REIFLIQEAASRNSGNPFPELTASPFGIVAVFFLLILKTGIFFVGDICFFPLFKSNLKKKNNYIKKEEREGGILTIINKALDGSWFLFQNVVLPGRKKADLDSVLVGPTGVWVLEVKNFSGEYRNIGEHWEYRTGKCWKLDRSSPSRQAQNNAVRLSNFLKA